MVQIRCVGYDFSSGLAQAKLSDRPWCDGRLIENGVSLTRLLLHTEKMELPVSIGQIDGRLQIMR